jgi:UPF0755 protein
MSLPRLAAACVVTVVVAACGAEVPARSVQVTVPSGATFGTIVDTLVQRGVVNKPRGFRVYARIVRADRRIRAGDYALTTGQRWRDLLAVLTEGRVVTLAVTIPEGFTLADMADRVAETVQQPVDSVRAQLRDPGAHSRWSVPGPGLEGYLFPDTYRFARGVSLDVVVDAMVGRYHAAWTAKRIARREELGMEENEVVTLASIIQAEARRVEEMPTISAVYHNRLRLGYRLQADPTVLYALGGRREQLLFAAIDSVADNPYNTYTQRGLPPGPIGAPGEAALEAALYPSDEPYLYFVARPDGTHIFTRSLEEHNRARGTARREWDLASSQE